MDILYRKGTADETVLRHSFGRDIFLPEIPEYMPEASHVVVDVGAHLGTFSCLMARHVLNGRVYAIEGCRENYEILTKNIEKNKLLNVTSEHLLLLDRSGSAHLYHDLQAGNWGHSAVAQLSEVYEIVRSESLADFIARNKIEKIDLLRMNCEGAEFPVIMSSSPSVLARIDNMLILHHKYLVPGASPDEMVRLLEQAGFNVRLSNLNADRSSGWIIAARQRCSPDRWLRYWYWKYSKRLQAAVNRTRRHARTVTMFMRRLLVRSHGRGV